MCRTYNVLYTFSTVILLSDRLPILLLGRVVSGIAATHLSSAFEAWMVSEYHRLELDDSVLPLGTVLGNMTLVSSASAMISWVARDAFIQASGSSSMPFLFSSHCAAAACFLIRVLWQENYGGRSACEDRRARLGRGMLQFLCDPKGRGARDCFVLLRVGCVSAYLLLVRCLDERPSPHRL